MNFLKELREQLGLTQQQLADWLKVNRGQVNMCEREQRGLPAAAMLRYLKIVQLMEKQPKTRKKAVPAQASQHLPAALKKLQKRAKRHDAKVFITGLQLEKLQQAYNQHTTLLNIVEAMHAEATEPYDKNYLSILKGKAADAIAANGPHRQAELSIEIGMHQHLAAAAREQHNLLQQFK